MEVLRRNNEQRTEANVIAGPALAGDLKMNYARTGLSGLMTDDLRVAAMTAWAAKNLPARLLAGDVAKLLNCSTDDVAILASAGKLRALGKPRANAVKLFSTIELIALSADHDWLDDATKTITQHWRRKNARRSGLNMNYDTHAAVGSHKVYD